MVSGALTLDDCDFGALVKPSSDAGPKFGIDGIYSKKGIARKRHSNFGTRVSSAVSSK